jgi:RNA-binding protein YlmH
MLIASLCTTPLAPMCGRHLPLLPFARAHSFMVETKAAVTALEMEALAASDAWDTVATDFIEPDVVAAAEARFEGLADVGFLKVGGYPGAAKRRFVFTNAELLDSMDSAQVCSEYAVLLRVEAAFDKAGNVFGSAGKNIPNLLSGIGIDFDQLGDVLIDGDDVAYIVCAPSTQKTIERLLPKVLGRASISTPEPGFKPEGTLVDMVVSRVDKRQNK